jgi:hypothetical protein
MRDSTEVIILSKWQVVIGVLALIVACVAIAVGLLSPEIRYFLGLEQRQKARLSTSQNWHGRGSLSLDKRDCRSIL